MATSVDQSKAQADGDVVGGSKTVHSITNNYPAARAAGFVEELMVRLRQEIEHNEETQEQIDTLKLYLTKVSPDGIVGLEAKLTKGGRQSEIPFALGQKELFAKLLSRYSLYSSAQEIFAFLLARADHRFRQQVQPLIGKVSVQEINKMIADQIVEPLVAEVGAGVFVINDAVAMGMIYWLAEQCYIRWHA